MKQYRLIEITREGNRRDGKALRMTIFAGPDKDELKKAIAA